MSAPLPPDTFTPPTPGPWTVELRDGYFPSVKMRPETLAGKLTYEDGSWSEFSERSVGCITINEGLDAEALQRGFATTTMATCIANAHLIAAAPDLLVALKAMVAADAESGAADDYLAAARSAIARAEGR